MNEFDKLIKDTLSADEAEFLKEMDEDSILQMLSSNFKGKMGWISVYAFIMTLIFFGAAVYAAFEFFDSSETKQLVLWATVFLFSMFTVSMLKIWQWLQMDKNRILREIKRLELQISLLAKQKE